MHGLCTRFAWLIETTLSPRSWQRKLSRSAQAGLAIQHRYQSSSSRGLVSADRHPLKRAPRAYADRCIFTRSMHSPLLRIQRLTGWTQWSLLGLPSQCRFLSGRQDESAARRTADPHACVGHVSLISIDPRSGSTGNNATPPHGEQGRGRSPTPGGTPRCGSQWPLSNVHHLPIDHSEYGRARHPDCDFRPSAFSVTLRKTSSESCTTSCSRRAISCLHRANSRCSSVIIDNS
ncbi:hypothetical protein ABIB82_006632 [Bradyrhizobium sp. i1.8.4]